MTRTVLEIWKLRYFLAKCITLCCSRFLLSLLIIPAVFFSFSFLRYGDLSANRSYATLLELVANRNLSLLHGCKEKNKNNSFPYLYFRLLFETSSGSDNRVGKEECLKAKLEVSQRKPLENAALDTYRIIKRWSDPSSTSKHIHSSLRYRDA